MQQRNQGVRVHPHSANSRPVVLPEAPCEWGQQLPTPVTALRAQIPCFFLTPRLILSLQRRQQLPVCYQNIYAISAHRQQPQEREGTLSTLSKDTLL